MGVTRGLQATIAHVLYVGLMLGQRLRRCPNIKPTEAKRFVFAVKSLRCAHAYLIIIHRVDNDIKRRMLIQHKSHLM